MLDIPDVVVHPLRLHVVVALLAHDLVRVLDVINWALFFPLVLSDELQRPVVLSVVGVALEAVRVHVLGQLAELLELLCLRRPDRVLVVDRVHVGLGDGDVPATGVF